MAQEPALARVGALGVLADDDQVDAVVELARPARERPQVHVEVEREAHLEQQAALEHAGRHVGRADRAEQDRVEAAQLFEHRVGQHLAGAQVARAAEVVVDRCRARRPVASTTFSASAMTSGPMPSPPMIPIRWAHWSRSCEQCSGNEKPPTEVDGRSERRRAFAYEMTMTGYVRMTGGRIAPATGGRSGIGDCHRRARRHHCSRATATDARRAPGAACKAPRPCRTQLRPHPTAARRHRHVVVIVVVVIAAAGFAGYWFLIRDDAARQAQDQGHRRPSRAAASTATWTLSANDANGSFVQYRVHEQFVGRARRQRRHRQVDRRHRHDDDQRRRRSPTSTVTANLAALKSDKDLRDNALKTAASRPTSSPPPSSSPRARSRCPSAPTKGRRP